MKRIVLAGAAVLAMGAGAHAASVTYNALPASGSYFAPTATSSSMTQYEPDVTGSIPNERLSPFSDTTTPYDSVENGGFAIFSASTFDATSNSFTFVWGSPDPYNKITFLEGTNPVDFLFGTGNGSGSYLATVTSSMAFNNVEFESIGANAFEFAAVSSVPLPAALPMFGGAVILLSGLGCWTRRKSARRA